MSDPAITIEALRRLAADTRALPPHPDDARLLSPEEVERTGGPKVHTQAVWTSTRRYGWELIQCRVGRRRMVDARLYRAWCALRTPAYAEAA